MKKSIKGKALSILASTAMALSLCALPMGVHAANEGNVIKIESVDQLANAIENQADGQTWEIAAGEYVLEQRHLDQYSDKEILNQGKWYFPLTASNLTLKGDGDVTIKTNVKQANGVQASQTFIAVEGSNISIDNIDFTGKEEVNKTIEVFGSDFHLNNSTLNRINEYGSGSIYFNGNIGASSLKDVKLESFISGTSIKSGNVTLNNVTIDFTDNAYAGDNTYGVISNPQHFQGTNLNVLVDSKANLQEQVFSRVPNNSTVTLAEDYVVKSSGTGAHGLQIEPANDNVTFDLNGYDIIAGEGFVPDTSNKNNWRANLVSINNANGFTLTNGGLLANGNQNVRNVLNVQDSTDTVTLNNVTLDHTAANAGAPLMVNNSDVKLAGNVEFVNGVNSWYAVNVDGSQANLTIDESANVTFSGDTSNGFIYREDNGTVTGIENIDGADDLENGKVGKAAATIGDKKYGTVQEAVIAAQNGETVTVKAGKHEEEVAIKDKAIELVGEEGAQLFNVTVINTTGKELSGLAIRNIDFYGASNAVSLDSNLSTVYIQGPYKNVVVENNQMILDNSYANEITVAIVTGHEINGLTVRNNTIKGYTISGYHNPNWSDENAKGSKDIVYTGNTIEDVESGIYFGAVDGVTVTGNTFKDANGVRFQYGTKIDNLSENKFINTPDYAVRFYDDGVDGEVDLSNNYWGTKDREVIESLIENGNIEYVLDTYYVNENMDEMSTDVNIFEFDGLTLNLKVGDTAKVNVTAKDYDGNNIPLTWSSKDEKVATVKDGVITAVGEGKTQILVDANGKVIAIDVIVTTDTPTQPANPEDKPTNPEDKPIVDVKPDPTNPTTEKPADTTKTDTTTSQPKTSDDSNIVLYVSIASLALVGAGILVVNKKRKSLL